MRTLDEIDRELAVAVRAIPDRVVDHDDRIRRVDAKRQSREVSVLTGGMLSGILRRLPLRGVPDEATGGCARICIDADPVGP